MQLGRNRRRQHELSAGLASEYRYVRVEQLCVEA